MDIKINTILESMEDYIENKSSIMLTNRIMVSKSDMLEYIKNIRLELPKSLANANKIYEARESIISDADFQAGEKVKNAENKANQLIEEATITAKNLIEEHEITRKAKIRAQEILDNAEAEAARIMADCVAETEAMRKDTFDFIDAKIDSLENIYSHAIQNVDFLKEEFNKNAVGLFHLLNINLEKQHAAVQGNKREFQLFRENMNKQDYDEDGEA